MGEALTGEDRADDAPPPRILCIDGGGLKGVMPAAFLAEVETVTGMRTVDQFDLIAGTSTGGIIAIGLGLGLSAAEIVEFYVKRGPEIFAQTGGAGFVDRALDRLVGAGRVARQVITSKYRPMELKRALAEVFGARTLGDSSTRLLIPAYDPNFEGALYVFKTAHHSRFEVDHRRAAVDAALATAAAPTYLPGHSFEAGHNIVDGGVWANNPMGMAAVEAAAVLRWPMEQVRMLSLGCSDALLANPSSRGLKEVQSILKLLFQAQDRSSHATAKLLLGHPHNNPHLLRVNPFVKTAIGLDDASRLAELMRCGTALAREAMPRLRECFYVGTRRPFEPVYQLKKGIA